MPTNDFLPFADDPGANVMSQADYVALAARPTGFESGKANSLQLNKAWRQGSIGAYMLGQIICDVLGADASDNSDLPTLLANLKQALASIGNVIKTITAAGPYAVLNSDRTLIVNQAVAAAIQLNLPAAPSQNFAVEIIDGKGDADVNNITISGNGHTINGQNTFVLNQKYQPLRVLWNGTQFSIGA